MEFLIQLMRHHPRNFGLKFPLYRSNCLDTIHDEITHAYCNCDLNHNQNTPIESQGAIEMWTRSQDVIYSLYHWIKKKLNIWQWHLLDQYNLVYFKQSIHSGLRNYFRKQVFEIALNVCKFINQAAGKWHFENALLILTFRKNH